ncbi:alpha/beta-hydrolase [Cryphonectria parasitica EP155]|uniref:Carboxylic ester hydrolase n=1 Tax=Cryphonectria parasitica (strain ATCC 38755 / EP155) TaxID=660469 RepID=A0A9P4Y9T6_CRYP1|nr:alpha/beta-hydrolase [Cryphonectria parasitica EP155]KAF3769034.1 alpha/beta-hydrolase [Cryphonectria parasitica EP155]
MSRHGRSQTNWTHHVAPAQTAFILVLIILLVCLLTNGLLTIAQPGQNPTVDLGYATYEGETVAGGINRFRGMRYAAAPVGDLRWRAPVSPPTSTDTQSAQDFGPICLGTSAPYPSTTESEDCLFVNVWAPSGANTTAKLPVWLFIQGGGYVTNANANWDGAEVVMKSGNQIVFVNFNYRVALWGFLASARVSADGALNAGLLDQRFLMQWVKTNIASFGGDPDNIVIHGASAGAGSVALHLTAYGGRDDGLFTAAIAESVFFPAQPFVPQLEYQFDRLVNSTGCADEADDDQLTCLRGLNTTTLQAQNIPFPFPGRDATPEPLFYWTPCIDGDFIRDLPYDMFASGNFVNVPLLFGNDNNEGSEFATDAATSDDMVNFLQNNYPLLTTNDTDAIVSLYPLQEPAPAIAGHAAWFPSASMAYGEATFICPAITILAAYAAAAAAASASSSSTTSDTQLWNYRYNVLDQTNAADGLGVPHLWESYAVFGPSNLDDAPAPTSYLTYDANAVPLVMDYFLSFVRTRDPNTLRAEGSPAWDAWVSSSDGNGSRIVLETNTTHMEDVTPEQRARCAFWEGLTPRTQQKKRSVELWEGHHVFGHEI